MFIFYGSLLIALSGAVRGDALVSATMGEPRTLIPIMASDSSSAETVGLIFNGLVKYDKDIRLTGDLAESWDIKDDGLTIVFHLRKNVRWHDGVLFDADDVKFTYEKLIDPNVRTAYAADFLKIKGLLVIDPFTVEVRYSEPFAPGLASWGMGIMPKHILEHVDLNAGIFPGVPVGTGPYRFKKWSRQEKIELTANPRYFEGAPYLSRVIERVIPDSSTAFLELQTRTIDASGLTPLQYTRQTENTFFARNYKKFRSPGSGYTYLGYNLDDPRFKDKRIRRALNAAVDKERIIKIVLLGEGEVLTGPFLPQSWAYDPQVRDPGYDPGLARQLLAQAGWRDENHDGILERDGRPFTFTILTNQGNELRIKTAEIIQKDLADIGIDVKIKVLEWSALLTDFIDKGRFDAVLLGWSLSRDPDCYDIWHSSKTRSGEFNFIHYRNAEVDGLLDQARRTFDIKERQACYRKIHRLIYDDQPTIFLYVPDNLEIVSSRIQGIEPSAIGIGYNLIKWWVPKEQQRYRTVMEQ